MTARPVGSAFRDRLSRLKPSAEPDEPISQFSPIGSKATVAAFAPLGHEIITGHESGKVALFDTKTGEEIESNERAHSGTVTDLQLSLDGTYFVTSSKDKTARVGRSFCCSRHRTDLLTFEIRYMTPRTLPSSRPSPRKLLSTAQSSPRSSLM